MEDIGIVILAYSEISLGGGIVALLKGIDKDVYQRIDQKQYNEYQCRQQVQPALVLVMGHRLFPRFEVDALFIFHAEQEDLMRFDGKMDFLLISRDLDVGADDRTDGCSVKSRIG